MFSKNDTVLFLDDAAIAETVRVSRAYNRPIKFGQVVVADRPWEGACVIAHGTVLPDPAGDGYRMWYINYDKAGGIGHSHFCYATSADGVEWEKPSLGLFAHEGSRDNNILLDGWGEHRIFNPTVVYDGAEPDSARLYKMLFFAKDKKGNYGQYVAFSHDGIDWARRPECVGPRIGDRTTMIFDPELEAPYVAYTRRHTMGADYRRRVVYRSESRDMLGWSDPVPAVVPDLIDSWDVQFYGMPVFKYRDLYIGAVEVLRSTPDRIEPELAISRDGRSWTRTRHTFLTNGDDDAWDRAWVSLSHSPPLEIDGTLWFYYEGRAQAHGAEYPFPQGSIGLAVLPRDRFAAIEAGPAEGFVTTKSFAWNGGRLLVNAEAASIAPDGVRRAGYAKAEIVDETGAPVEGFRYGDAVPLSHDMPSWEPSWTTGASLQGLRGRTIALRVYLLNSRLYAVSVVRG